MGILNLPYPISVNRYWRNTSKGTYISQEGKEFKESVAREYQWVVRPTANDVALEITIHPRQRANGSAYAQVIDLDNGLKCILDSLNGIVYHDDKQVKEISIKYGNAIPNGGAAVKALYI